MSIGEIDIENNSFRKIQGPVQAKIWQEQTTAHENIVHSTVSSRTPNGAALSAIEQEDNGLQIL